MTLFIPLKKSEEFSSTALFDPKGWHVEPSLLSLDDLSSLQKFVIERHALLQLQFETWVGSKITDEKIYSFHQTKLPEYESKSLPKDLRHFLTGEFDLESRLQPIIVKALTSERIRTFVRKFLNVERFFAHHPPMIRFKSPNAPSNLVPVHQDIAYNNHLKDFVTIWIPLGDIDESCGGIVVYEGSHLNDVAEHRPSGAWSSKALLDLSVYPRHHLLMNAGDALFFPPTLFYESAPHTSSRIRYSLDLRVFSPESNSTKSYFDDTGVVFRKAD